MFYLFTLKAGKTVEIARRYNKHRGPTLKQTTAPVLNPHMLKKYDAANLINAERTLTYILNANFDENDYWVTLAIDPHHGIKAKDMKTIARNFLRWYRKKLKNANATFKYIYAASIENGFLHLHMVLTGIPETNVKLLIMNYWSYGFVDCKPLYEHGDHKGIANYIIKNTEKSFRTGEAGMKRRYQSSRGLIRPKWEIEAQSGNDWELDPDIPDGYRLINGSLVNGFNSYNEKMYQRYRLIQQKKHKDMDA